MKKGVAIVLFVFVILLSGCSTTTTNEIKEYDKEVGVTITTTTTTEAVNNATSTKIRDEKRLSDIKDLHMILGLYFGNWHRFPVAEDEINVGGNTLCTEYEEGFIKAATTTGQVPGINKDPNIVYRSTTCKGNSYINLTSSNPPVNPGSICPDKDYTYLSKDGKNYSLKFCLEEGVGNLTAGNHEATKEGIK
jgi:hypothetical protein